MRYNFMITFRQHNTEFEFDKNNIKITNFVVVRSNEISDI